MSSESEFFLPLRIYIEDTDAGGIVYYVNYLKFMERARTERLRELGFAKPAVLDEGRLLVVANAEVDYRKPARLDDYLRVSAKIRKIARSYLVFEQQVMRDADMLCRAEIRVACVTQHTHEALCISSQSEKCLGKLSHSLITGNASMNQEPLSILYLIGNAGLLVQGVMALLMLASIVSWAMIVYQGMYQKKAKTAFRSFEKTFWSGVDLTQLYRQRNGAATSDKIDGWKIFLGQALKNFPAYVSKVGRIPMRLWRAPNVLCAWP